MAVDDQHGNKRSEFWMKVAAWAFGLWSIMIPIGVTMVSNAVERIVSQQAQFQTEFKEYVLQMERRVTIIEERQSSVLRRLDTINSEHDSLLRNGKER